MKTRAIILSANLWVTLFILGCQQAKDEQPSLSLRASIDQVRRVHFEEILVPGRTLEDTDLQKLLSVKPSRTLGHLAGHRYTIEARSVLRRSQDQLSSLVDTVVVHVDAGGSWRIDHSTSFENRDERSIARYRGCMEIQGKSLVSNGREVWTEIRDQSVDGRSCLDTSLSWVCDLLSSAVDGIVAEVEPNKPTLAQWVRINLKGLGANPTRPIPLTWQGGTEVKKSNAIFGPRGTLLSDRGTMQRLVGHLVVHRRSGTIRSAHIEAQFAIIKGQAAALDVTIKKSVVQTKEKVEVPAHRSIGPRHRIHTDIKKLLRAP